ncbi:hypothetical protein B0A48_15750 [Cryoendolithus antarcticus]|uniref:Uncharacterized protein n=1 Tax=Cryoendolithus antarcticus TaxID=1507870 RepID=A0A1V8SHB7_9PEZI|nr:hypothetical protein B0A48_15750 [Cryoendolithus antarcticus]
MKDATGYKEVRLVLRAQLLRCEWPRDILRIMAVAMLHRKTAEQLCLLHEPIMRALYRCRNNVTDKDVLSAITVIITRFNVAGLRPHDMLIHMGFKFAARARSLRGMKRFLKLQRERDNGMSRNQFRSVIAKFSIGHRGLGEIRNGRWRRSELLQVLTGFDDDADLSMEKQYHLGSFLHRQDWQYLHGWVAVLARCKASDAIWEEWQQWKVCDARRRPKTLQSHARMNTRIRGDYWFIEQMAYSGDIKRAWQLLGESDVPFERLKSRVTHRLLDHLEYCTVWSDAIATAMLRKYDYELGIIEKALGVTWEALREDGDGRHVLFRDQEEALEELSADSWTPNENFGFPHADSATLATEQEQSLHDAPEGDLVDHTQPA